MAINAILGAAEFGAPKKAQSSLDMAAFLKLLTVQLATQNPLKPMDDNAFFGQMAQLGTVQGMDQLKISMDGQQAAGMIGKTITAIQPMTDSATGTTQLVTGVVKSLSIRNGNYYLEVKTAGGALAEVTMANVQSVSS